jgi:thioredoxin reductase
MISKELIIIGAGPAGLRAGEEAQKHGIDYVIIEKGEVGAAWRSFRPDSKMLSPCHPQRDWTSISSSFPIWKLPVERPYCNSVQFISYLDEFAAKFKLNIVKQTLVTKIEKNEDQFLVHTNDGKGYSAPYLITASGIFDGKFYPNVPGIKGNPIVMHSHNYMSPIPFINKRVLIVGAGNSAAEVALELAGKSILYLATNSQLKYFLKTRKLYHIRGVYESFLKEFIEMEFIRYMPGSKIKEVNGHTVIFENSELKVHKIIFATGYQPEMEFLDRGIKISKDRKHYPKTSDTGESVSVENLFFAGPLALNVTSSVVLHGFLKYIPKTINTIVERLKKG